MNKKKILVELGRLVLTVALVVAATSWTLNHWANRLESEVRPEMTYSPTQYESMSDSRVINLLFAGSTNLAEQSDSVDYSAMFTNVRSITSNYSFAFYLQKELVYTDVGSGFADSILASGFNAVGLASRSALDNGSEALLSSLGYWQNSIAYYNGVFTNSEEARQITMMDDNGISVSYLSFTDGSNEDLPESQPYLLNIWDDESGAQLIEKAASATDVVVVSIDWENDDSSSPTERQQAIAKIMADSGASVIVGYSGSLQPVSWIDDTLIFYSLGDLVNDSDSAEPGALGAVTITESGSGDTYRVELTNPRVQLIETIEENGSYKVTIMDESDALYETYGSIIQAMDDSIRLGGLQ